MTEAIKNGKNPFADEKAGAGKGKKGGSAGLPVQQTEGHRRQLRKWVCDC